MMHRVPALLLQTSRQTALSSSRHIATSSILLAKGRKTIRYPPPAQAPTSPGQEGDDVGRARPANGGGLFEGEGGQEKVEEVTPDSLEREMLASQGDLKKQLDGEGERENLAGTDVGQGGGTEKISTGSAAGEKGEYGASSLYSVPHQVLALTSLFSFPLHSPTLLGFTRSFSLPFPPSPLVLSSSYRS